MDKVIGFAVFFVVYIILFSVPLWFLWNWIMPEIFSLKEITLLQSIGMMFLSNILFIRKS